jgi:hypothetical protein
MTEHLSAIVLILTLLGISFYYAWRQFKTLRWLRTQEQMMPEDRQYYRRQAIRRLIGCGLTLVLALLLIGIFALGVMEGLDRLIARGESAKKEGRVLTDEEEDFVRFSFKYVGVLMLVLLVLLVVVFLDLMAIRRFGMRHRKRIREDRRAMLMRQLPLLRREREENG